MKTKLFLIGISTLVISHTAYSQKFRTQEQYQNYFLENHKSLEEVEGIWYVYNTRYLDGNITKRDEYLMAIIKEDWHYTGYILEDGFYKPTPITHRFESIYLSGVTVKEYIYYRINSENNIKSSASVNILNNKITYSVNMNEELSYHSDLFRNSNAIFKYSLQKYFPLESDILSYNQKKTNKNALQSGSCFAISSDGLIVTNYHIIDGTQTIQIRGVNGDFNKTVNAKVLVSDKNNDLALIKIDNSGFSNLSTIPFVIKTELSSVGENIFVLGYPLRATMGDEIKLTNGIISSKTGFQGDITSYQISAPVQPGNSGAPLFDSQGNLVGIINSKHIGAENASYAVKSSYLMHLLELLPNPPKLTATSTLKGKSLATQAELLKKFVYIIEVN